MQQILHFLFVSHSDHALNYLLTLIIHDSQSHALTTYFCQLIELGIVG